MVRAVMMTKEQIAGLVDIARRDDKLWSALKDREISQFTEDGSPKRPSLTELVRDFAKQQYGPEHTFDIGSLTIQIRYNTRKELGLPV
jgi:hypothetical protein